MGVPETVTDFLSAREVSFQLIEHRRTATPLQSARAASVPPAWTAKAVVVEDGAQMLLAIVPATHRIDLQAVSEVVGHKVELAEEEDFATLFRDCRRGAVPPLAEAYGVQAVVDSSLAGKPHLYLESGDHEHLIHVGPDAFLRLFARCKSAPISMVV
jgi:Ala-tRNA(Pro) deacylase